MKCGWQGATPRAPPAAWYGNAEPHPLQRRYLRCLASVLCVLGQDAIHIGQDLVLFRRRHQRNFDPVAHDRCNFVAFEPQRLRHRDDSSG